MIPISYDMHIHSCLSPCGDDDMTPGNIVGMASLLGLDAIALTDHNTSKNCPAFLKMAEQFSLIAIPGMELTTAEEAHVLCLFGEPENAEAFEAIVRPRRMAVRNRPEVFGRQLFLNAEDEIVGEEENLLILATSIRADEVQALCRRCGGVAIPAHIDKPSDSLLASLGRIDPELGFPICEVTPRCDRQALMREHPELAGVRFLTDSDAHDLGPIGTNDQTLEFPEAEAAAAVRALYREIHGEEP